MTGSRPDLYARALELDDHHPDHVCPGCGMDLSDRPLGMDHMTVEQWTRHVNLYYGTNGFPVSRASTPFVSNKRHDHCEWTNDMIVARAFRRRYIRQYERTQ